MIETRIRTTVGVFRVKRETTHTYKGEYKQDTLKLGGRDFCVEFKWHKDTPTIVELQWLNTSGQGCELDGKVIKKESTIHLFDLSVTLLKEYTPVKDIILLDNSKFPCALPTRKQGQIFMNYYYFLFHNATWYDDKFGAYPKLEDERASYSLAKINRNSPEKKPENFDFKNKDLSTIFEPLYDESNTWGEFLDKVYKKYKDNNICSYIFPWYLEAALLLTDGKSLPMYWILNAETRPSIPYSKNTSGGGLRRFTSRKKKNNEEIRFSEIRDLPYFR